MAKRHAPTVPAPKTLLRDANRLLGRQDHDKDRADTAAWTAEQVVRDARVGKDKAQFRAYLSEGLGLGDQVAEGIAQIYEDRDRFVRQSAEAVARVPKSGATTEALSQAHEAHLSDPKTRQHLMRPVKSAAGATDTEWAPLVHWLHDSEQGLAKTVKGEALARMDLYVRSGWAEKDLANGRAEATSQTGAYGTERSAAADHLRDLVDGLRRNGDANGQEITEALDARWQELFVPMSVKKVSLDGTADWRPVAFEAGLSTFSMDGRGTTEGGGRIDAFIRDANDSSAWHMAFASSGEDSRRQGDQMTRHVGGVLTGMELGAPPFGENDRLASIHYYAPAIVTRERAEHIGLADSRGVLRTMQESVNRLALYAQLDDSHIHRQQGIGDAVLATRHMAVGAGSTTEGCALQDVDPKSHAQQIVGAIKDLAHVRWNRALERAGETPVHDTILPLAMAALNGMASHYPETVPDLRKAIPSLNAIARQHPISETGLAKHLSNTALTLKHGDTQPLPEQKPLSEDDKIALRARIDGDRDRAEGASIVTLALRGQVDARDGRGNTALHIAAEKRDLSLARKLLDQGAQVDAVNADQHTPLHVAAAALPRTNVGRADNGALIGLMAEAGGRAAVNLADAEGDTALHLAAAKGQDNAVMHLLKNGADLTRRNNEGETARDLAAQYGSQVRSPTLRQGADKTVLVLDTVAALHMHAEQQTQTHHRTRSQR
ncbi:ankyrin repeat domain-containing protein [Dyella psychrodurans]|uniref:Ankyrin repeat domain-containing protein n=1 Tax=Dyella psychrodurans TaxID=1927960 RepID=A0A370XCB5_9GAMM|nr:ankyrin repeat domain-containing protein [Dyella psychrodurans]RDS85855.1 ankyrin repeat domain-containing protein [Dyella psychrodurans]